jgi:hypothetical protein
VLSRVVPDQEDRVGLGGTVDYEVTWDATVIDQLVLEQGITRRRHCLGRRGEQ